MPFADQIDPNPLMFSGLGESLCSLQGCLEWCNLADLGRFRRRSSHLKFLHEGNLSYPEPVEMLHIESAGIIKFQSEQVMRYEAICLIAIQAPINLGRMTRSLSQNLPPPFSWFLV